MKKFLTALTACAVLALAMCSLSLAYDNTNADWGVKIDIQKDGSVNISYDAEKVNGTKDGWNAINAHIAIYDADPGFTADSKMADFEGGEQKHYPYTDAVAGNGNAGRVDESNTYNIKRARLTLKPRPIPLKRAKLIMYTSAQATERTGTGIISPQPLPIPLPASSLRLIRATSRL